MKNNFTILSTKILKPYIKQQLINNDFNVIEHNFIKIENVTNPGFISVVNSHLPNYIFTSKNAVRCFAKQVLENKIKINKNALFCALSGETQKTLSDEGFTANITAENASSLAKKIVQEQKLKEAIFFCGDKRRDELPEVLQDAGVILKEMVLYKSIDQSKKIENGFQAIMFYSPSAIQSFFKENSLPKTVACFCIGYSTASALKDFKLSNKIVVSNYPSQQNMVDVVLNYFNIKN